MLAVHPRNASRDLPLRMAAFCSAAAGGVLPSQSQHADATRVWGQFELSEDHVWTLSMGLCDGPHVVCSSGALNQHTGLGGVCFV